MKCYDCNYYKGGYMWNGCGVTGDEYFRTEHDCTLVNDDGTINFNDEYFANGGEVNAIL